MTWIKTASTAHDALELYERIPSQHYSDALASAGLRACRSTEDAGFTRILHSIFLDVSLTSGTRGRHREEDRKVSASPKAVCQDLFSNPESCIISNSICWGSSVSPRERTVDLDLRSRSVPGIRHRTAPQREADSRDACKQCRQV